MVFIVLSFLKGGAYSLRRVVRKLTCHGIAFGPDVQPQGFAALAGAAEGAGAAGALGLALLMWPPMPW